MCRINSEDLQEYSDYRIGETCSGLLLSGFVFVYSDPEKCYNIRDSVRLLVRG